MTATAPAPDAHVIVSEGHRGAGYELVCSCGMPIRHKSKLHADGEFAKHREDARRGLLRRTEAQA